MLKRKVAQAAQLGMTLEEYNNRNLLEKAEKKANVVKLGLTAEGRKRISDSLKKRWQDPVYREKILGGERGK